MRHVMVLNAKGGCGKSTLSTNIAVFLARDGHNVCIADYDPQRSSLDWLAMRPRRSSRPSAPSPRSTEGLRNVPRNTDVLVIDAPARVHGTELNELVRRAETIIVPVAAVEHRHESLWPFHGGAAGNRQGVAQAGTPLPSLPIGCASTHWCTRNWIAT